MDTHQHSGSGVIFQHDLVDNSGPRLPELNPVLLSCTLQEVEYLFVGDERVLCDGSDMFRETCRNIVTSRSACAPLDAWIR